MQKAILKFIFVLFILAGGNSNSFATITIDSVITVNSSCTNNGSATIYASSSPASTLLYAIVAGPTISPIQNSDIFPSLFPGNYTVRVYNANFDSAESQFQIAGNYQLPDFTLEVLDPTCPASSDGSITVAADTSVGLQPFLYSMISPNTIPPQPLNIFTGLPANTYQIRVTDACGNYQTRTAVLSGNGTGILINGAYLIPSLIKTGCDTMEVTQYFYMYKEKCGLPITLTLNTTSGSVIKTFYPVVIDTIVNNPGLFKITDTIANITYGDYLQVILTDVCGESVYSMLNQVAPFDFDVLFYAHLDNCATTYSASITLKQYPTYPYDFTIPISPVSFTLTDIATNTIVDSMSMVPFNMIMLKEEPPGNIYSLTVTDGCGQTWQKNIQWPVAGAPYVNMFYSSGCLDSTAVMGFECHNFQSAYTITILSGPPVAQSTKPHYAYSENMTYPVTFPGIVSVYTNIKDCPAGVYTYEISDSCGNVIQGTYVIEPYMVSSLNYTWYIKPSCLNNNTLFYNFQEGTPMAVYASITDVATNTLVIEPPLNYALDSISTLPIGQYALEIAYANHNGSGAFYDGSLISNTSSCWVLYDTITIVPYTNSSFITNTTIYCNGTNYIELIVDSTRGVPPYKFEIISGPQTFPQQDSGIFLINIFGNYLISIEDDCGNNYTQQITLSSDSFPPITKDGFICAGHDLILSALTSTYFSYLWQYPDGTIVTGDSISFHPFSVTDTGTYHLTKIVNINGCSDTLYSEYYLSLSESIPLNLDICEGDSVFVGTNVYTIPGVYYDTLSTSFGCDSIIVTTLSYIDPTIDSSLVKICYGDSIIVGSSTYQLPGTYIDTVIDPGGCLKIMITSLQVDHLVDSLTAVICEGDSFLVGNVSYYQPGFYHDTLTSASGCDSIIIANIIFAPLLQDSIHATICKGDSISAGNSVYYLPGIYNDTVMVAGGCKQILVTTLSINDIIQNISTTICQGDSFYVGNSAYSQPGIYQDTLLTSLGCDSIIILDLLVTPQGVSNTQVVICEGDSIAFGNSFYAQTGVYTLVFSTAGCDSIATLDLTVNTLPVSIIQTSEDSIKPGNTVMLTSVNQQATNYSWTGNAVFSNTNLPVTNAIFYSSTWIHLWITDANGCSKMDSVFIFVENADGDTCDNAGLFIPNVFTPNNDGMNDVFKIIANNIEIKSMLVFNRWGEQIFESKTVDHVWDGTFRNSKCEEGVYYYLVQYESCVDGSEKSKRGSITLIK